MYLILKRAEFDLNRQTTQNRNQIITKTKTNNQTITIIINHYQIINIEMIFDTYKVKNRTQFNTRPKFIIGGLLKFHHLKFHAAT